jgi:hypothetical protein
MLHSLPISKEWIPDFLAWYSMPFKLWPLALVLETYYSNSNFP